MEWPAMELTYYYFCCHQYGMAIFILNNFKEMWRSMKSKIDEEKQNMINSAANTRAHTNTNATIK